MFWCKQASRKSTVNNVQHKWFATFGLWLFCIEWLLEEPFCVGEAFSMGWWWPLKLDIWFCTFKDAEAGNFFFWILNSTRRNLLHHHLLSRWMNPLRHHLYRRHRHWHHLLQGIWKYFWQGSGYAKCLCTRLWQWSRLACLPKFCELTWSCTSCFLFYVLKNSNGSWIVSII